MKRLIKNMKFQSGVVVLFALFANISCSTEEEAAVPPTSENAKFSYSFDPDNQNKLIFTGEPDVETWFTHWDFGDNTAAEEIQVEKEYFMKGDYNVRFKIFTEGGTAETIQTVSIEKDIIGPNLVENGTLDGDVSWTVLPIAGGMDVEFKNGTAVWTGGGFGHVGIYQQVSLEANTTYQVDMDIVGDGLTDSWFEVYVGTTAPMDGVDYTDGGMRLGLKTWDGCGADPFDSSFSSISCKGDGIIEFPSDLDAYLVIRGGGADYGGGLTIDNISVRSL